MVASDPIEPVLPLRMPRMGFATKSLDHLQDLDKHLCRLSFGFMD